MARTRPPRKVTYFEPVPPRLARNTIIEFDIRGRPPLPLHDARRLRPARSRRGDPAGARRMVSTHARAARRRGACGLARRPRRGLSARRADHRRAPHGRRRIRDPSAVLDTDAGARSPLAAHSVPRACLGFGLSHACGREGTAASAIPGRVRGAIPPCGPGSSESRQRRGVGGARGATHPAFVFVFRLGLTKCDVVIRCEKIGLNHAPSC